MRVLKSKKHVFLNKFFKRYIFSSFRTGEGESEKIYLKENEVQKSFWHDLKLKSNNSYNMVIEIPAQSRIIIEMNKTEPFTPLLRKINKVVKNSEHQVNIRDYSKDPMCNYGFFPQTYSNKEKKFRGLYCGDGDPLDVIEIGGPFNLNAGSIIQVKLLGSFCLIDQGEMDWKIVVANESSQPDPKQKETIDYVMYWFRMFKTFYGKKENTILDNNKFFTIEETLKVIEESHLDYNQSKYYEEFAKSKKI